MASLKTGWLLFLLIAVGAGAQTSSASKFTLRFNPLGVVDFLDNNFTPGIEYRPNKRWSVGADVGYIFTSNYTPESNRSTGVLFRPFVRVYPNSSLGLFLQGDVFYKRVQYRIEDWLGRAPVNGVPSFEEFTTFNYTKRAMGVQARVGRQYFISADDRLRIDFSIGLGVRFKKSFVKDGIYEVNDFLGFRNVEANRALAAIPVAFHVSYQLK